MSGPVKVDQLPKLMVVQNIPVGPKRNDPFHLISNPNFWIF